MYIDVLGKNHYISEYDDLWDHTMMRIKNAKSSAKSDADFAKKMVTRLRRITKKEKVYYAIAALQKLGYYDLVEIYEGSLLMDFLTGGLEDL